MHASSTAKSCLRRFRLASLQAPVDTCSLSIPWALSMRASLTSNFMKHNDETQTVSPCCRAEHSASSWGGSIPQSFFGEQYVLLECLSAASSSLCWTGSNPTSLGSSPGKWARLSSPGCGVKTCRVLTVKTTSNEHDNQFGRKWSAILKVPRCQFLGALQKQTSPVSSSSSVRY